MKIGIRELRANAAVTLRRAAAGEHITVTVDGRPAAVLGPIHAGVDTLDALIASGQVLAPRRRHAAHHDAATPVPVFAGARLDRLLRELRG